MNRLRIALTLLVFMVSLAVPPLVEAGRFRARPRVSRSSGRFRDANGNYSRSRQARAQNRGPDGRFRPGFRGDAPSSGALVPAGPGTRNLATTRGGGRLDAGGSGGGTRSTAVATRDGGGSTALARRDAGGPPATRPRPGADTAGMGATEAAFHQRARQSGWEPVSGPNGTRGYRDPVSGAEAHFIPAEGRIATRRPDGTYEMTTVLNRDAIDNHFARGGRPDRAPRAQLDTQPIGGRNRGGNADGPTVVDVTPTRTTRGGGPDGPSTTARASADGNGTPAVTDGRPARRSKWGRRGRALLFGTAAFSGGYALRNAVGDPTNNTPGSIDPTSGFGQGNNGTGNNGTGTGTNNGGANNGTAGTGGTGPGGVAGTNNGTGVTSAGDTRLGSGALYPGSNGNGGGTAGGAPGVGSGDGNGNPNGITGGDLRPGAVADQDQDGFSGYSVQELNRPPARIRLNDGSFNFE